MRHPIAQLGHDIQRWLNATERLYKALVDTKKATGVDNWTITLADPGTIVPVAIVDSTSTTLTGRMARVAEPAGAA